MNAFQTHVKMEQRVMTKITVTHVHAIRAIPASIVKRMWPFVKQVN